MQQKAYATPTASHRKLIGLAWALGHCVSITGEACVAFLLWPQGEARTRSWQGAKEPWRPPGQMEKRNKTPFEVELLRLH